MPLNTSQYTSAAPGAAPTTSSACCLASPRTQSANPSAFQPGPPAREQHASPTNQASTQPKQMSINPPPQTKHTNKLCIYDSVAESSGASLGHCSRAVPALPAPNDGEQSGGRRQRCKRQQQADGSVHVCGPLQLCVSRNAVMLTTCNTKARRIFTRYLLTCLTITDQSGIRRLPACSLCAKHQESFNHN